MRFSFVTLAELKGEDGWTRHGYVHAFPLGKDAVKDNVERVVQSEMRNEEFAERYEKQCKPCVVVGAQDNWQAGKKWIVEVRKLSVSTIPLKNTDQLHLRNVDAACSSVKHQFI